MIIIINLLPQCHHDISPCFQRKMSRFKSVKCVLFDMDGLILDTENLYTLGTQTILQEYGKVVQEKSSTFIFPGSSYRFISFRFVSIRFDSIWWLMLRVKYNFLSFGENWWCLIIKKLLIFDTSRTFSIWNIQNQLKT